MIRRSPSRNHRSRGFKVKYVLQIILLLGVCFWLIYQVKHSHDKKKEYDENDAKVSFRTQAAYQTPKLGRKDLHPSKDDVNQNEKHEEEEEDENIVEDEDKHEQNEHEEEGNLHESEEKKENKHGMRREEEDEDENKSDEMDDERGRGDNEIDENDQELSAVDTDRDEEFMDEEKEKEEEHEVKEDETNEDDEKDGSVKNHNSHEAREEHYKGDDASSAVTHDTHTTTSTETETVSVENSDVNSEMNIMKSENKPNDTEESDRNQHNSNFNITEVKLIGGTSSNTTSGKETGSNSLSNAMDTSQLDNITTTHSHGQSEASNTPTLVIPGGSNSNNMTGTSADTSSGQNKIIIYSESNQTQKNGTTNITVTGGVENGQTEELEQGSNRVSEENRLGPNSTVPVKTETGDAAAGESSNLEGGGESTRLIVALNETETSETNKTQNISYMKENTDATKEKEFKGDTQRDETSGSSSVKGTSDSVEHRDTDSSGSNILKDVAEVRTDQNTLPDIIRTGGDNGDATATD